jgi:hypothetical protein
MQKLARVFEVQNDQQTDFVNRTEPCVFLISGHWIFRSEKKRQYFKK